MVAWVFWPGCCFCGKVNQHLPTTWPYHLHPRVHRHADTQAHLHESLQRGVGYQEENWAQETELRNRKEKRMFFVNQLGWEDCPGVFKCWSGATWQGDLQPYHARPCRWQCVVCGEQCLVIRRQRSWHCPNKKKVLMMGKITVYTWWYSFTLLCVGDISQPSRYEIKCSF